MSLPAEVMAQGKAWLAAQPVPTATELHELLDAALAHELAQVDTMPVVLRSRLAEELGHDPAALVHINIANYLRGVAGKMTAEQGALAELYLDAGGGERYLDALRGAAQEAQGPNVGVTVPTLTIDHPSPAWGWTWGHLGLHHVWCEPCGLEHGYRFGVRAARRFVAIHSLRHRLADTAMEGDRDLPARSMEELEADLSGT